MVNLRKNGTIVRSNGPIGLFGGGRIGPDDLNLVLNRVTSVVAADGGAAVLVDSGRLPDAVIGDFDSLGDKFKDKIPANRLFLIQEQDSTDFDKALRNVQAPLILGAGFLGGRLDHQMAVLNTLIRYQDQACILIGEHEVVFHAPPKISLAIAPGDIVSLFPLARVTGRSKGLEWPIEGLVFEPDGQAGTSNRALSDVELHMDGPGLLVMMPRAALDQVMQAFLSGQTGLWPARVE
ncbi:thiamine diphosphokinase [Ruegeria sp. EL01]|jgi:thiamine pyrophosphokinase|uniref:thiamine diphosphokinase n=1 Tax=Ruegeria sp. EL01 TaxID=2107578 RepID=UPI000EA8015A|nr:thiamine diphosphokinase [Ruegeria sp. EL01]